MAEYHHHQRSLQESSAAAAKHIEFKPPPEAYRDGRLPHEPARIPPEDFRGGPGVGPPYVQVTNQQRDHSRPSSSSSQPDYTQVSPAKMALRRHLSQEKLVQQIPGAQAQHPMSTKTIGDLVNGEIERTLEISNQSIINAAVNMSTLAGTGPPGSNHTVINTNIQRPERVSVRLLEEQQFAAAQAAQAGYSPVARPSSRDLNKSPITQNNLATLAQVAYTQQKYQAPGPREAPTSSKQQTHISPRTQQYSSASTTVVYQAAGPRGARADERYMLPRAEMKPYLESYFTEDHKPHHLAAQREHIERRVMEERRMRDDEKPLEGKKMKKLELKPCLKLKSTRISKNLISKVPPF